MQIEMVRLAAAPLILEPELLVMAVTGGVGDAIHIGQRFGMAEAGCFTQGQIE